MTTPVPIGTPERGAPNLGPRARRRLALRSLQALQRNGFVHAILRNADRLLEDGQGDLDLWVPAPSIPAALEVIQAEAAGDGWRVVKRVARPYASSLYLYRDPDGGGEESVLAIDLFPCIRWYAIDLIPEDVMMARRVRRGDHWVIEPRAEAAAAVLHHLAWNADVPERYARRFRAVDDGLPGLPFVETVRRVSAGPVADRRGSRRSLLLDASLRALRRRPAGTVRDALSIAASLLPRGDGRWVSFQGDGAGTYAGAADAVLRRNHFLVGRWGSVGPVPARPFARAAFVARTAARRRFGAVVLSNGAHGFAHPDLEVRVDGDRWALRVRGRRDDAENGTGADGLVRALVRRLAERRPDPSVGRGADPHPLRRPDRAGTVVAICGGEPSERSALASAMAAHVSVQPAAVHLAPAARVGWPPLRVAVWWSAQRDGWRATRERRRMRTVFVDGEALVPLPDAAPRVPRWWANLLARTSWRPDVVISIGDLAAAPWRYVDTRAMWSPDPLEPAAVHRACGVVSAAGRR